MILVDNILFFFFKYYCYDVTLIGLEAIYFRNGNNKKKLSILEILLTIIVHYNLKILIIWNLWFEMLHDLLLALLGYTGDLIIDVRERQHSFCLSPNDFISDQCTFVQARYLIYWTRRKVVYNIFFIVFRSIWFLIKLLELEELWDEYICINDWIIWISVTLHLADIWKERK